MSTRKTVESLSVEFATFVEEVTNRLTQLEYADVATPEEVSDFKQEMDFRIYAIKEAGFRLAMLTEGVQDQGKVTDYVTEALRIAAFILGEEVGNTTINNYNDHYHIDTVGNRGVTPPSYFTYDIGTDLDDTVTESAA